MDGVAGKLSKEDKLKLVLAKVKALDIPGYLKDDLKSSIESLEEKSDAQSKET